jgi:hypothetical protein
LQRPAIVGSIAASRVEIAAWSFGSGARPLGGEPRPERPQHRRRRAQRLRVSRTVGALVVGRGLEHEHRTARKRRGGLGSRAAGIPGGGEPVSGHTARRHGGVGEAVTRGLVLAPRLGRVARAGWDQGQGEEDGGQDHCRTCYRIPPSQRSVKCVRPVSGHET